MINIQPGDLAGKRPSVSAQEQRPGKNSFLNEYFFSHFPVKAEMSDETPTFMLGPRAVQCKIWPVTTSYKTPGRASHDVQQQLPHKGVPCMSAIPDRSSYKGASLHDARHGFGVN